MLEFFRGWRRKIGIVTLILALAIVVLGMRSRVALDLAKFPFAGRQQVIVCVHGRISWSSSSIPNREAGQTSFQTGAHAQLARQIEALERYKMRQASADMQPFEPIATREISIWLVAAILTGFSAVLLLRPQRTRFERKDTTNVDRC